MSGKQAEVSTSPLNYTTNHIVCHGLTKWHEHHLIWCRYQQDDTVCQCLPKFIQITVVKMVHSVFSSATTIVKVSLATDFYRWCLLMNFLWLFVFEWRPVVYNQDLKYIEVKRLSRGSEKCDVCVCWGFHNFFFLSFETELRMHFKLYTHLL